MLLDLSKAYMGREFRVNGGPSCGEAGNDLDHHYMTDEGDLIDGLREAGYVRTDLGGRLTYTWGPIVRGWCRER